MIHARFTGISYLLDGTPRQRAAHRALEELRLFEWLAEYSPVLAGTIPIAEIEIPSGNFLLHLTGKGDSIAMCVFENREQDVKLNLAGKGAARVVTGSEIEFGKNRKIWLALLEAPRIWHTLNVEADDAKKIMPLDWRSPFQAQWRVDFSRTTDLTDSWEMLLPEKDGPGFVKPTWLPSGSGADQPSRTTSGQIDQHAYQVGGPASNRLDVSVEGGDGGILVMHEQWYPGWRATVNGEAAEIERVDHVYRGVRLPPGDAVVRTWYQPASLRWGVALTLVSCAGAALLVWRLRA